MKLKSTGTKYIDNDFAGVPQLINEYGSLNSILEAVLVTGFNEKTPSSVEVDNTQGIVIINYESPHGYKKESVITLEGADESSLNREYRIFETDPLSLRVFLPEDSSISSGVKTGSSGFNTKYSPLGFSLEYSSTEGSVKCYKNKSKKYPAVLKVIDEIPENGYRSNWAKFARVVAGTEVDSDGNFINNSKVPYHYEYPDAEYTGDNGSSGSNNTIYGFAKWRYASGKESYGREYYSPDETFPREWKLIGDGDTFYFIIYDNYGWSPYGFGIIDGSYEISLQASDGFLPSNNTSFSRMYNRAMFRWPQLFNENMGNFLYNRSSNSKVGTRRFYNTGFYADSRGGFQYPWRYDYVQAFNPFSGKFFTSRIGVLSEKGDFLGYHRGVEIFYSKYYPSVPRPIDSSSIIIEVSDVVHSGLMPLMFSLEDWEVVE